MGTWRARLARASGTAGVRAAAICMVVALTLAAVILAFGMPWIAGPAVSLDPMVFTVVVVLMAIAHTAGLRMRLRIGATNVNFAWGEAALIVGFTLIPAVWMPAAVGLGVLLGNAARNLKKGDLRTPLDVVRSSASLTVAAGFAAMVVDASRVNAQELTPPVAGVLAGAALLYLLTTLVLLAFYLGASEGESVTGVIWNVLTSSPIMIIGNLALGLLAALLWQTPGQQIFLLVLPPLLLFMHQLYSHRINEAEERRKWRAFALASSSLHRLDDEAVAQEGVRAATDLFEVKRVELMVFRSGTTYASDGETSTTEALVDPHASDVMIKPLEVAGSPVGELTLVLERAGSWSTNDQHRLAAFGDALAAALHDAATHSALRELHERTAYESLHDPLTKLLNRDALLDRGHALLRACPPNRSVALILLDIDNFKAVNDTLGHLAGDELLQRTGQRLTDDADVGELVARPGGDEFALLMTELPFASAETEPVGDPLKAAHALALRRARALTAGLAQPTQVAGVRLSVEVTAGVVVATAGPVDLIELLRRAEVALYQARRHGVRTHVYQEGNDETSTDRLAMVAELQNALSDDEQLKVVYLPTVNLATGTPIGIEALTRWHHPRRGLLNPKDFIRAVEASDLLGQFTYYVLDRALATAAELAKAGLRTPVSVNLSPRSLLDTQLPIEVAELLRRHGVPGEDLILEIIETVVLSPLEVTNQVLHALRNLGVRFAGDDFGTGYSSLTFVRRIPVAELKIDRTFVAGMEESREASAIVRTVIDLAQRLNIRVVAEGVETAAQRRALVHLGCDAGQGFHFAKPAPPEQILEVLNELRARSRAVRVVQPRKAIS